MKIITLVDRNEDFIPIQNDSLKKYVIDEFQHIVFNNGSSSEQRKKITDVCSQNGILEINCLNSYMGNPSDVVANSLKDIYKNFLSVWKEPILYIDSDMFLINDLNISELETNEIGLIPMYRGPNHEVFSIWSGFWYINFQKITSSVDFGLGPVNGINTDVMGKTHYLLQTIKRPKIWNLYNIYKYENDTIETNYCAGVRINFKTDSVDILDPHISKTRVFPHETVNPSLLGDQKVMYQELIKRLDFYGFPKPYNVDFICAGQKLNVFHFKSSNWCPWYYPEYVENKKQAMKRMIDDNGFSDR